MNLIEILKAAKEADASDIHLVAGHPPVMRVHTVMTPMNFPVISPDIAKQMFQQIAPREAVEAFDRQKDADFSFEVPNMARYRVNAHNQRAVLGDQDVLRRSQQGFGHGRHESLLCGANCLPRSAVRQPPPSAPPASRARTRKQRLITLTVNRCRETAAKPRQKRACLAVSVQPSSLSGHFS
ncbi:MAG: hypothetical protein MUF25_20710 [Pirellulaceae bacterium]|nr:hypothetical protein [Pirellulaceae bacterium]